MDENTISFISMCFRAACAGAKPSPAVRDGLQAILDRMDEAERAGSIAAIIKIMLG